MRCLFHIDIPYNRVFGLDLLRALAILFVVIGHGNYLLPERWTVYIDYLVFDGVAIFFVLSGYLIGSILIRLLQQPFTGSSLLYFWIRRWCRTLPNYFLVLVLLCIINYYTNTIFHTIDVFPYFIFSQNLLWPHPYFFGEAWSISIEEWFYLLLPLLLFFQLAVVRWKPDKALLITAVVLLISVTCFRWYRYEQMTPHSITDWDNLFRKQVVTRLDSLMYGVIGAHVRFRFPDFWKKYRKLFLALGVMLFLFLRFVLSETVPTAGFYHSVFSFSLVSFATLCLLPALSSYRKEKGWFFRMVTRLSLISYSLYLLHLSFVQFVLIKGINKFYELPNGINYTIYWLLSIFLSILLYKYYERPTTALRDLPFLRKLRKPLTRQDKEAMVSAKQ